ncbi:MAG: penicillin-binding transpeptidase domain-containing protein, partial [Pseudomonadota bacterium]
ARSEKRAHERARVVMRAMQREGYIEPGTIDIATVKPGENAKHFRSGPEHFVTYMVAKRLRAVLGEVKRDVIVRTTIDPFAMLSAQSAVDAAFASKTAAKGKVSQAALVSMAPDGAVKALIGGRNYAASQFNRAADAKRQPGSAFKSFVWLAALENGRLPSDVISDAPVRYGKWAPKNYGNKHYGQLSLSRALAISSNTVAARLIHEVGPQRVATVAQRLGIESKLSSNYSLALGSSEVGLMELAAAHAPFANGGQRAMPHIITRITDTEGRVLHEHRRIGAQMVVWPANVGEMNRMLRGVVEQGTARKAQVPGHMIAGKTGTSQQFRDAVFVGWSAHAVTAVWFGNDNNSPTRKLTGGSLPASTFANYMGALHQGLSAKPLPGFNADEMLVPLALTKPTFRPGTVRTREELVAQVSEETPKRRSILDILLQR